MNSGQNITVNNPYTQFKNVFEFWVASVLGIYSQDFTRWNGWIFNCPEYTQQNLTGMFWEEINEGWECMQHQTYMMEYLERFDNESLYREDAS